MWGLSDVSDIFWILLDFCLGGLDKSNVDSQLILLMGCYFITMEIYGFSIHAKSNLFFFFSLK